MFSNIKLKKLEFFFKAKIGVEKSYFFVVISHINNQYKIDIKTYTRIQIQIIVIHRFFFYFVCDKSIQTDSHNISFYLRYNIL